MTGQGAEKSRARLVDITLDETSITRGNANITHEREVAIFDILDGNEFALAGRDDGPYQLKLSMAEDKLAFAVSSTSGEALVTHHVSLTPFKRILKDYFLVLESYYAAIRASQPSRIQAIDVGRRGLHDEGSRILAEKLEGRIAIDFDTARRLFTLIAALHWKG